MSSISVILMLVYFGGMVITPIILNDIKNSFSFQERGAITVFWPIASIIVVVKGVKSLWKKV